MRNNKIRILFVLFLFFSTFCFARNIRISIIKGDKNVMFEGKGFRVSYSGRKRWSKKIEFRASGPKLFVKKNKLKKISRAKIISTTPVKINGKYYRGNFEIFIKKKILYVINIIDIEKYLYGVIKSEILINSPPEALKAQAVVARTYSVQHIGKHSKEGFDLCNTTHCQMYSGVSGEDPRAIRSVDSTRSEVINYRGKPVSVFFSSNCGGITCSNTDAWGSTQIPYLVSVKDPYCHSEYGFKWDYLITPDGLKEILNRKSINIGIPVEIVILKRNPSHRVQSLKVIGTKGETIISGKKWRAMIGYKAFKSENFDVKKIGVSNSVKDSVAYAKEKMNVIKIIRSSQNRKKK